jgi:hypothetical protein
MKIHYKAVMFNLTEPDHELLVSTAKMVDMNMSEVGRRALRLGLARIRKLKIPGSPKRRVARDDISTMTA